MKEILEIILKNIVMHPEDIQVEEEKTEKKNHYLYKVHCNKEDMGRVIGKNGKVAHAIRLLTKSIAQNQKLRINIEFVD